MTWTIYDYAKSDCKKCNGGGLEVWNEGYDWGDTTIYVPVYYVCECVDERIANVSFEYYSMSTNGDAEIPF